jgi:hypothetical protein
VNTKVFGSEYKSLRNEKDVIGIFSILSDTGIIVGILPMRNTIFASPAAADYSVF